MASTQCPHGLDPAQCLICKTLGTSSRSTVTEEPPRARSRFGDRTQRADVQRPDVVYAPPPSAKPRNLGMHMILVILAVVLLALAAWMIAGLVFAVLHLIELVLVAAAAGWAGYRLGHFRGSRDKRS